MASKPKDAAPVVDQVLELDPDAIDASGRIGFFFPEKAEAYAALIQQDGQRTPITVRRNGTRAKQPWTLVAGRHRHAACAIAGIKVRALVVSGEDAELRAVQASENLDRRDLVPLERAMFVAAVADAAKARLRALHGGKSQQQIAAEIGASERAVKMTERSNGRSDILSQRSNENGEGPGIRSVRTTERMDKVQFTPVEKADADAEHAREALATAYRWSDAAAAACGMGVESLKRSLRIFRIIVEPNRDLMDAIKDHPVAANASALLAICAKGNDPANVRAILEWLIAHPEARTADEAIVALELAPSKGGGAAAAPDAKRLSAFIGTFGRMPLAEKKGALGQLGQMLPAGFEIVEKGQAPVGDASVRVMRGALRVAADLIAKLSDGEPVDDDEIRQAREATEVALDRAARLGSTKGEKA
ncbi:ParB N-terminal domain-containing protein [Sphingopyxis sp. GW247-27LB]|uniref:ParB/RepB/Spo0J family partition protein n=1 Tax=Sphingopyxis sp. GW247-27LB TaxID=2012632 RepID=UPI000BA5D0DD|nr:ParB N-terminal domain-containing protein [Sphingopyxis sp. GW247-27LB]PAL20188.1 hypothetical protein CD928_17415 [Sphingopyxis sp. GW247-27LB]